MIGCSPSKMFFDRKEVIGAVDKATRRVLSRFGAYVRRTARQSIRRRKRVSKPGQPPTNQTGLLKRFIFFGYDRDKQTVVIGPEKLSGPISETALSALEYGGRSRIYYFDHSQRDTRGRPKKTYAMADIEARPFMGPAFEKELPGLPAMWRDSVR